MLVTFSGVDCSGKSTQLELLDRALSERGHRVVRYWYRPGYSGFLDAVRRQVRRSAPRAIPAAGPSEERNAMFARPGVAAAWLGMACTDMLAQYGATLRSQLLRGRTVLCDRYLEDSRLDLELRFPAFAPAVRGVTRAIELASPRPTAAFLLVLPWDEMLRRMEEKNEPFTDPPDVRRARYDAYLELASSSEFVVLDATRSADEIHQSVLEHLDRVAP